MSDYERKPNTATLFVNNKENERQPDFAGPVLLGKDLIPLIEAGVELRVAGWKKTAQSGTEMINLMFSEKKSRQDDAGGVPF